jgi:TPR repeat protein
LNTLGVFYERGHGVRQEDAKARDLYNKAAAGGDGYGMNNLGRFYQDGRGGPKDYAKAREWYGKAAAKDNKFAPVNLAELPQVIGGTFDYARGAKVVLELAKANNEEVIQDLKGEMRDWRRATRTEIKRELARLGHYSGPIDDKWDDGARTAVGKYLGQGR